MTTEAPSFFVIRRDGTLVPYNKDKIRIALSGAYRDAVGAQQMQSQSVRDSINNVTNAVERALMRSKPGGGNFHIEDIQDQVELVLMRDGKREVAREYVLFREQRAEARKQGAQVAQPAARIKLLIASDEGFDLSTVIQQACEGLGVDVQAAPVISEAVRNLYDGISVDGALRAGILAARTMVERDPGYTRVTARLLMHTIRREARAVLGDFEDYPECFARFIGKGVETGLLDERLRQFDLKRLGAALKPERDNQFDYLGLQTLYDRYFLHVAKQRMELPQAFFMRVAMGLSLNEIDRESRAIEFYELLSSFDFMSSTPTLFNAGTSRAQLSSCYLTTVPDDLAGIYDAVKDNALLSKYAGGLGNDWTPVRALGSHIKGTNGDSQGVVPFLKVANDTAVAVNQGGRRKGAVCAYLETWHLDIEEFLELRKNTGDDRRRTHDMNTANWIPDLFMHRVVEGGDWTLFSPSTCPDLHDLFGIAFEQAYTRYEAMAQRGEIKLFKRIRAVDLWRKMLSMLFETGHPWITFKDACNVRSPQQHVGVVHSSNLCTEVTLNTSADEIAVCNLGSVNLAQHLTNGPDGTRVLDTAKLKKTVSTAMRMLDNVIDINYYAVKKARDSNLRHRPVGLGRRGFQDALYQLRVPYASQEAVEFADRSMEAICYHAYWASTDLAAERGRYHSFSGSLWDKGILPLDSLKLLAEQRGGHVEVDTSSTLDWAALRTRIGAVGMRNSNCVAIAPTATISNIIGVDASIEPSFGNLSVKSNLSGEFTIVNEYLVRDLKKLGLWDDIMVMDLKHFDGSLRRIDRVPEELKSLYATAFEVEPHWLVEAGARRQKWIDQAQSLNIYMAGASGKKLDETYKLAWLRGLKTTYYLRTTSASNAEKSTVGAGSHNAVSSGATHPAAKEATPATDIKYCAIDDPGCQACQ